MFTLIIPAAGKGRRLKGAVNVPKMLIKVRGKLLLEWQLLAIGVHRIEKLVIIGGYRFKFLKKTISDLNLPFPVLFIENEQYALTNAAYSLFLARQYFEKGFIYLNSDLLFSKSDFLKLIRSGYKNVILSRKISSDTTDQHKISLNGCIIENMDVSISGTYQAEAVGPAKVSNGAVKKLLRIYDSFSVEKKRAMHVYSLFGYLAKEYPFYVEYINDQKWIEIDTPANLKYANHLLRTKTFLL